MNIQQVLRWIVVAIVLIVAFSMLSVLLDVARFLLWTGLKLLFVLFLVALALRFFDLVRERRR